MADARRCQYVLSLRRPSGDDWPSQRELLFGRAVPFRPRPPAAACRAQLPLLFLRASIVLGLVQIAMAICYGKCGDRREERGPVSKGRCRRRELIWHCGCSSVVWNFFVIQGVTAYSCLCGARFVTSACIDRLLSSTDRDYLVGVLVTSRHNDCVTIDFFWAGVNC